MIATEPRAWSPPDAEPGVLDGALITWSALAGARYALPGERGVPDRPGDRADEEATAAEIGPAIVLVAEDEEIIAETLALIVEDAGYIAVVARDGREALALARQYRPRLIITDLMMPHLSGADLIAAVRGDAVTRGVAPPPVVVVTAMSRARAAEAGAEVVITKPFDVAKLEAAMRRLLGDDEG